ncbi:epoxide hydrolase family protein [Mumia quercus]|uniref:epoxide hydrolase family protein n=1 Tax=Mumia quercus TaxID=2976125 RepID=UPI0021D3D227|nr:epoxide hydrolase [Mumia quercus]
MQIQPFTVEIDQSDLDDLRHRVRATRWPDPEPVEDWSQGVPRAAMRELAAYWADHYDWRRLEARLKTVPQLRTRIDGVDIHFLHVESSHPDAIPLVLTHGWPGSFVEFLDVLEPLAEPVDDSMAFHVVVPSLPGYGFSGRPTETGWGIERIARAWAELMRRLGYDRYGASGGDWGTSISTMLGLRDPEHVLGLHLTPPLVAPEVTDPSALTPYERESLELLAGTVDGSAYARLHATRPQTLGYGLSDSPVGLAAWIFEKLAAWADVPSPDRIFEVLDRDRVLDNITLYWLTGTAASSARLYWESHATVDGWFRDGTTDRIDVPVGAAVFRDNPRPSRRWAEQRFSDIRYWSTPERGGHFAAFEQPEIFVRELRASFAAMRERP